MHKLLSSLKYQGKVLQEEFGKLLGGKRTSKATAHLEALEELLTEKIIFYILHKSLRQLENVWTATKNRKYVEYISNACAILNLINQKEKF